MAAHPERFPTSGRLAKAIRTAKRSVKGPAQPQSRRNKRKARQERRQSFAKRRRAERRETVAAHNAAREALERDLREMEESYQAQQERLAALIAQDKLTVEDLTELLTAAGAPSEIIEAAQKLNGYDKPRLIVP